MLLPDAARIESGPALTLQSGLRDSPANPGIHAFALNGPKDYTVGFGW